MSKTIDLDLPHEFWKDLKVQGVGRDGENEKAVSVYFTRGLSNAELRSLHEFLRQFPSPTEAGEATTSLPDPALTDAIEWLETNQRQLDQDGIEVAVSRQALEQVLAALKDRSHV